MNGNLQEVRLSGSQHVIERYAFLGCSNLVNVVFQEGLRTIEPGAFLNSGVEEIALPYSLQTIGKFTFKGCRNLRRVSFKRDISLVAGTDEVLWSSNGKPDENCRVASDAFDGCEALEQLVVEDRIFPWPVIKHSVLCKDQKGVEKDKELGSDLDRYDDSEFDPF